MKKPSVRFIPGGGGGWVLPYIGYTGMCHWKGYMVFKPFSLVWGLVIIENWSSIGSRLTGSLTKD